MLQACDKRYDSYTVIDAGTGPVPVMAISAALLSSKARIIGMELDGKSFLEACKVIHSQGLKDRIKMLNVDATNYQFEDGADVKVIISETMGPALLREPIVKILRNLKNQFPDAICIPESVKVWPHLKDLSSEQILESGAKVVRFDDDERIILSGYVPPGTTALFSLATEVNIGENFKLSGNDSLLSQPVSLLNRNGLAMPIRLNSGSYQISYQPGCDQTAVSILAF